LSHVPRFCADYFEVASHFTPTRPGPRSYCVCM
jgi:hypothetical protein